MSDPLLYNWDELFNGFDFPGEALKFFHAVGHTIAVRPVIVADDILYCIYSELNYKAHFDDAERSAFSCISSLSHLFTIDDEVFCKTRNAVQYLSVVLKTAMKERTIFADIVATAFAKSTADCLVILFRHDDMCMLSFSRKKYGSMTLFSDWFGEADVTEIIQKVDIANLSLQSSDEFICDLIYIAARSYYTRPISRDYAHAEWSNQRLYVEGNEVYTVEKNDFINELMYAHISEYGDDYIGEYNCTDYQVDAIGINEYDFDLLELELDEMIANGDLEFEDEDYTDEDIENVVDSSEHIFAEEIPLEIMDNPIALLKWLSDNEQKKQFDKDAIDFMTDSGV